MLWVSRLRSHETGVSYIFKSIGKSKALAATLSDIESEDDSDNKDDGILNAFTTTFNPTEGIVEDVNEEEEFVESKFEKMMIKMIFIQPIRNYTSFLRNMRNFIG